MKSLKEIEDKYEETINQVLSTEEEKFKDWDIGLEKGIKSVEYERDVYLALVDVLYTTKGKAVYSDILSSSTEFAYLSGLIDKGTKKEIKGTLTKAFHVNFSDIEYNDHTLGSRLFGGVSIKDLKEFLTSRTLPSLEQGMHDENFPGSIQLHEGNMLIITLRAERKASSKENPVVTYWNKGEHNKIIIEFAVVVTGNSVADSLIYQEMNEDERIVEVISDGYNLPTESVAIIKNLEREIFEKFADNERRVWGELEPAALAKYKMQQDELTKLHGTMESLKSKIEEEKSIQEKILREMRETLVGPSGSKLY